MWARRRKKKREETLGGEETVGEEGMPEAENTCTRHRLHGLKSSTASHGQQAAPQLRQVPKYLRGETRLAQKCGAASLPLQVLCSKYLRQHLR